MGLLLHPGQWYISTLQLKMAPRTFNAVVMHPEHLSLTRPFCWLRMVRLYRFGIVSARTLFPSGCTLEQHSRCARRSNLLTCARSVPQPYHLATLMSEVGNACALPRVLSLAIGSPRKHSSPHSSMTNAIAIRSCQSSKLVQSEHDEMPQA